MDNSVDLGIIGVAKTSYHPSTAVKGHNLPRIPVDPAVLNHSSSLLAYEAFFVPLGEVIFHIITY